MKTGLRFLLVVCLVAGTVLAFRGTGSDVARASDRESQAHGAATKPSARGNALTAFASEKELKEYLKRVRPPVSFASPAMAVVTSDAISPSPRFEADSTKESITNTQHADVDEGGIVKLHGQQLVVLRRGRLFTVDIGNGQLMPISVVDAFGPQMSPDGAWYDELLVSESKVVVIGYSYQRVGTELGLFDIDAAGHLTYRSTYHLRSNDYYSTRNYASRLVGNKLILYSPLAMPTVEDDRIEGLPGLRRWQNSIARAYPGNARGFVNIATPASVYRVPGEVPDVPVLHTLTTCDLSAAVFDCKATSVVGDFSEVFYVSPKAVYVWTGHGSRGATAAADAPVDDGAALARSPGTLYRMPLDGGAPQAIGVHGNPVDQLSFDETNDGYLNVVVRASSRGDWMGNAEMLRGGEVALLHLLVSTFGDGTQSASALAYRRLPTPEPGEFQNRFVQGKLLYGVQSGQEHDEESQLFVVEPASGYTSLLGLPHGVERIEVMGDDAVVIGSRGKSLHFSGIRLAGRPTRVQHYELKDAAQGETRSQGFFYKPGEKGAGLLGLPVQTPGSGSTYGPGGGPGDGSAAVVFLQNANDRFEPLGKLASAARPGESDSCRASCVDWYGNARPIFVGGRVLALMGYEIVEGKVDDGAIRETRRVTFAPHASLAFAN